MDRYGTVHETYNKEIIHACLVYFSQLLCPERNHFFLGVMNMTYLYNCHMAFGSCKFKTTYFYR